MRAFSFWTPAASLIVFALGGSHGFAQRAEETVAFILLGLEENAQTRSHLRWRNKKGEFGGKLQWKRDTATGDLFTEEPDKGAPGPKGTAARPNEDDRNPPSIHLSIQRHSNCGFRLMFLFPSHLIEWRTDKAPVSNQEKKKLAVIHANFDRISKITYKSGERFIRGSPNAICEQWIVGEMTKPANIEKRDCHQGGESRSLTSLTQITPTMDGQTERLDSAIRYFNAAYCPPRTF